MLLQDLYRVSSDNTWVTVVTGSTVFSPIYNGLLTDMKDSISEILTSNDFVEASFK